MNRSYFLYGFLLAITAFFVACNKQVHVEQSKILGPAKKSAKIDFALDWTPNTNHTGLVVAQKLGYFSEAGLEVTIHIPQTSVTQLVANERAHFGIAFQEFATHSMANDQVPIISVAAVMQHNTSGFTFMKNRNIQRPRDFGGKLYAGWGNPFETTVIKQVIQSDGGEPNLFDSVTIEEASVAGLLQEGKVDYVWTYYAWQNIGFELQGLETDYIPLQELDPVFDYYTPIIITSRRYLAEQPNTAKRFMQAVAKGYEYAANNPDESADILLDYAPELERQLVLRSARYLAPYYVDENGQWGYQKPEVWDRLSSWMYEQKLIERQLSSAQAMTNELLPR